MAKFLDTTGISYHLEQIIKKSEERLILISPYLKLNNRIKEILTDRNTLKIDIRVIYGKNDLQADENNWLSSMDSIRTSFCENLHAKCYLNENEALITSMNLYDFSQANNNEMGILVSKKDDSDLYADIYEETKRLVRISEERKIRIETIDNSVPTHKIKKALSSSVENNSGHCIRCDEEISLNPTDPYCKSCYTSWAQYENDEYPENHCHICGIEKETSMIKPTCYPCYKKNKNKLEFNI